jgi:hypothetical protein
LPLLRVILAGCRVASGQLTTGPLSGVVVNASNVPQSGILKSCLKRGRALIIFNSTLGELGKQRQRIPVDVSILQEDPFGGILRVADHSPGAGGDATSAVRALRGKVTRNRRSCISGRKKNLRGAAFWRCGAIQLAENEYFGVAQPEEI